MVTPLTNCATIQDFINIYELNEAIEISNLCGDELNDTINTDKLQAALDNAHDIINSRYLIASDCGRALIKTSCKQLVLWVARYIADTTKSRPMVDEDYKRAMEMLEYACKECADRCPLSSAELEEILGENISRRSRLRCYRGNGNRFFGRHAQRIKVDRFATKNGFENYLINRFTSIGSNDYLGY